MDITTNTDCARSEERRTRRNQANSDAAFEIGCSEKAVEAAMKGDIESVARYESSPADLDREDGVLSARRREDGGADAW